MIVFNCLPDSVTGYAMKSELTYYGTTPEEEYQIHIWWQDGRESDLSLRDKKEVEIILSKLEKVVREIPVVAGFRE